MKRVKLILLCALAMVTLGLNAQNITVKGTVSDAKTGEGIPYTAVFVRGGNALTGTTSDEFGQYQITVAKNATLTFSAIGYAEKEVAVNGQAIINVAMDEDQNILDETVVIAYGTAKKSSLTGSVSSIDSEKLELRPITNVSTGVEGLTTGVLTTSSSGQPGSGSSIIIRGFGSINASSEPLYVVDGAPYNGSMSSLNPADIESISILKDASASALYGARAANGVVMITTKSGKEGAPKVTWRSTLGWNYRANKPYDMLNQTEYVQMTYEAIRNGYVFNNGYTWDEAEAAARANLGADALAGNAGEHYNPFKNATWDTLIDPATGQVRTDLVSAWNEPWMDLLLNEGAPRHEHQFSLSGGTNKTKYMVSMGYLNEEGILVNTSFQRFNARANVSSKVNKWFSTSLNTALNHSIQNFSDYSGSSTSNVWYSAQFVSPLFPVYLKKADGTDDLDEFGNKQLDYGEIGRPGSYNDYNPLGGLLDDKADTRIDAANIRTNITLGSDDDSFGAFKGLKLAVNFSADYRSSLSMRYMNMYHGNQATAGGLLEKSNSRTQSYTLNELLTYNRTVGKHTFDFLAGHEYYDYNYRYLEAGKTNLVDGIYELRPATTMYEVDSYSDNYRIESWLGRANYDYDGKYYLSASARKDGNSRFHKDYRWGQFWSIGGNWRVTAEEFMKDVTWLDNLSVKASYGEQGNDQLGTLYAWQSLYDLSYANGNNIGGLIASLENKELSWEKNGATNWGFDAAMYNYRLNVSVDWYNKLTTDMLLSFPMALSTGFSGFNSNVGNMRNKGVEVTVNAVLARTNDFRWNVTWMGSTVKNTVLKLNGLTDEIRSGNYIIKEGYPINTFYMAKSAGVDPATGAQLYWAYDSVDKSEVEALKEANKPLEKDGKEIWWNEELQTYMTGTEYVTSDYSKANVSRYFQGCRIPDLYGSFSTDLSYKNLTLSVLTTYSIGGKVLDGLYSSSMDHMYHNTNWNRHILRRWQKPGDITDVPRVEINAKGVATDRWLIDASYFAIKNITLGYNLPKKALNKLDIASARLFASVDNYALYTHLQGMDPQYNFSGGTGYTYTPNKTYTVGVEINF